VSGRDGRLCPSGCRIKLCLNGGYFRHDVHLFPISLFHM
jgi:hypothetical protein